MKTSKPELIEDRAITPIEAQIFLMACQDLTSSHRANTMWHLYFRILWETGVRASEALALKVADVGEDTIKVHRLKKRTPQPPDAFPIQLGLKIELTDFITRFKVKGRLFPVTYAGVYWAFQKVAKRSALRPWLTPHSFRHGFGMNLARQAHGLSEVEAIAMLQRLMGHSRRETTEVYIRATMEDSRKLIEKVRF